MMLRLPAPAKLNLLLHIIGRRADGYHELQTVFQLLDHGDSLDFRHRDDGQLQFNCSVPALAGDDNLVLRAARLLQPQAHTSAGCDITLHKRLPTGGGLGGGSSDAATTLLALNQLWHCALDDHTLATLGLHLGADVPVFLAGHTAWAEGLGEQLQPMALPEDWFVVLTPRCHVATARIFTHPALTRDSVPIRMPPFPFSGSKNDCESVTCLLHPEVRITLEWLAGKRHWAPGSEPRMSGTGASVFARCAHRAEAEALLAAALAEQPVALAGFVARGCNRSPLHAALARYGPA